MFSLARTALLVVVLCMPGFANGETPAPETPTQLPTLSYKDATGKEWKIGPTTHRIYASADRVGDGLLKDVLNDPGQAALDAQGAVVVADLSEAPRLVRPLIRSSLRDRRYTTLLDETGAIGELLPFRKDQITIVELDRLAVRSVRFVADAPALRDALGLPATP